MKIILLTLLTAVFFTVLSACSMYDTVPSSEEKNLIECVLSTIHMCQLEECESFPILPIPREKFPLKLNLTTGEVVSYYEEDNRYRSVILHVEEKQDRKLILAMAEKSPFNKQPMVWLMQIDNQSGKTLLTGTGTEEGIVIFGKCRYKDDADAG